MNDVPTFDAWRMLVGVSYTRLRDAFYALGIVPPEDGKHLMRVFRALLRSGGHVGHVKAELSFSDIRTIDGLFERSGFAGLNRADVLSLDQFLDRQRFVPPDHPLLQALRSMTAGL